MKKAPPDDRVDAITALMIERERYTTWLHGLNERRQATSPHVFDRVHADYSERLRLVMTQLAGRAADVESSIASLSQRLQELRAESQRHRDERDEAELRATVGEYAPDRWEEIKTVADAAMAKLDGEQDGVRAELNRLEQVLAVARPAQVQHVEPVERVAPVAAPAPAPAPPVAHAAPAPRQTSVPSEPPIEVVRDVRNALEPMADLVPAASAPSQRAKAGGESQQPRVERPEIASAPREASPGAPTPSRAFDELAFLNSVMDAPEAPRRTPALRRPIEKSSGGAIDLQAREGAASLASKTLRCGECGTMNYPTEWYCERCGGELSAL